MVQSLAPGLPAPLSVWGWLEGQVGSGNCLTMCGLWGPQLCIVVSAACTLLPPAPGAAQGAGRSSCLVYFAAVLRCGCVFTVRGDPPPLKPLISIVPYNVNLMVTGCPT